MPFLAQSLDGKITISQEETKFMYSKKKHNQILKSKRPGQEVKHEISMPTIKISSMQAQNNANWGQYNVGGRHGYRALNQQ